MIDKKRLNLTKKANLSPFNRHALKLLKQVRAPHPEHVLHALSLLIWGLEKRKLALAPEAESLQDHLNNLLGHPPAHVANYLNLDSLPQKADPVDQAKELLEELNAAATESLTSYPPKKLETYR
jgi:hypothetical protein